ncbi:Octopamine receptor beta-1R [Clonorchis sinensis]|uniref:Octopamine receptor beta-1R n=1 Tax=Clonorchis sinensis TaxID=79923 RepID=A0A3R7K0K5_CLOSI|nr:Octopamine receptor beta-1R [Clonorchis sinensis]
MAVGTVMITLILLSLSLLTLLAFLGNTLVVISVRRFPRLRSQFCFHILSGLAAADICVSVFVMPWSMVYLVLEYWPFGLVLCNMWMSSDVMCCTASILHLCLVAFDRYLAIAYPLRYGILVTKTRIRVSMVVIWLTSAAISFFPIHLGWFHVHTNSSSDNHTVINFRDTGPPLCELEVNAIYAVVSSSTSFYVPFVVCVTLYSRILYIAHQQFRQVRKIRVPSFRDPQMKFSTVEQGGTGAQTETIATEKNKGQEDSKPTKWTAELRRQTKNRHGLLVHSVFSRLSITDGINMRIVRTRRAASSPSIELKRTRKETASVHKTELKAIKTIGLLLGFFSLCWLPFFVAYLVQAFCTVSCKIPHRLTTFLTWIGYANSAVNPVLYGFLQRDFRAAFCTLIHKPVLQYEVPNLKSKLGKFCAGHPNLSHSAPAWAGDYELSQKPVTLEPIRIQLSREESREIYTKG